MKSWLTLAAAALLGTVSVQASAQQPWLADRRYGEGIGVRVGDLELHPGVAAEVGYDSNYFLRAPSEDPLAAYRLRVTPSITLSTLVHSAAAASVLRAGQRSLSAAGRTSRTTS